MKWLIYIPVKILAIWLVFYKGYSVIRFTGLEKDENGGKEYASCNVPMEFDYGHNGVWGIGDNPFEAVLDCYKQNK